MEKCKNCYVLIPADELRNFNEMTKDECLCCLEDLEKVVICPECGGDYC